MIEHKVEIRVRYAETDQMAYVYYGNYASYFEVARVETFRLIGFSYKELEAAGVMMPVVEFYTKYLKPAKYDDLLTIKVWVKSLPGIKILFDYEVYNEENNLLTIASTTLVFVHSQTGKPCNLPEKFQQIVAPYFT